MIDCLAVGLRRGATSNPGAGLDSEFGVRGWRLALVLKGSNAEPASEIRRATAGRTAVCRNALKFMPIDQAIKQQIELIKIRAGDLTPENATNFSVDGLLKTLHEMLWDKQNGETTW
jgi:hypothetical protein